MFSAGAFSLCVACRVGCECPWLASRGRSITVHRVFSTNHVNVYSALGGKFHTTTRTASATLQLHASIRTCIQLGKHIVNKTSYEGAVRDQ